MDRFVNAENIKRFQLLADKATKVEEQKILMKALAQEKARLCRDLRLHIKHSAQAK